MKKFLLRLQALAMSAALCVPLLAQSVPPDKSKAATEPKVEAYWSRQESTELIAARAELVRLQQRYLDKHPLVIDQRQKIENLEKTCPWVFSIDFPGGSLRQLLGAIASPEGMSFNVIGTGDSADFATELPPFSVHNANLISLAKVLDSLLNTRGFGLRIIDDSGPNSVVGILGRREDHKPANSPPTIAFDSFNLVPYLASQSIDDIVGAIRTGWELDPAHNRDALRLKFHPPTSILLVSGSPEAISVAHKIILTLKRPPDSSESPKP